MLVHQTYKMWNVGNVFTHHYLVVQPHHNLPLRSPVPLPNDGINIAVYQYEIKLRTYETNNTI